MNTSFSATQYPEPKKLVENRTSYAGEDAIFSVYDTYKEANRVELHASHPMYCGMISGRKIIHTDTEPAFDFNPSESLVLPPDKTIYIDFPDAHPQQPTKCITIELPLSKVDGIVSKMNEQMPRHEDSGEWEYDPSRYVHFANTRSVDMLIEKLFYIFTEEEQQRDLLIDINVSELIVHMLQTESRKLLMKNYRKHLSQNGLAAAIDYINNNLTASISIKKLADSAHMSKSSFYRYFKNEFGMTPLDYIHQKRVQLACKLLQKKGNSVTDVSYELGYSSLSHFIKLFKNETGTTPKQYQLDKIEA
ncbi:MAG: helix-turn-helix domain-containing protein [Bacteroidota bacterium]